MNSTEKAVCALCFLIGVVLPMGLLALGVILAWLAETPFAEMLSAAMIVLSMIVFLLTAAAARLMNRHSGAH
ncbi:hypothetical protein RM190_04810 [Paracoccus sp. CPCC 101403]|uniref:Uncharacterized protein n=1 Tax=Paracoccus broussonetiae TaxID=3075834 RepID=A0ABU3EAC2_9RHOB|nr:hypothetical protein [Paracoccus sp. CPCC 101403]MDT1061169.1 hypothetical protein [Paracoccus sp. CPCC 101403]